MNLIGLFLSNVAFDFINTVTLLSISQIIMYTKMSSKDLIERTFVIRFYVESNFYARNVELYFAIKKICVYD